MRDYLKHHTITLKILSPVYIGSGNSISKKEYIFDRNSQTVHVPNQVKMMGFFLKKRLLERFEKYLLNDHRDFAVWLRENHVSKEEYLRFCEYSLDSGDAVFEDKGKKEIQTFIKDAYNCPYIPGSSLKGALRTALLAYEISENRNAYSQNIRALATAPLNKRKSLQAEMKAFEKAVFSKKVTEDESIDVLSGLRISDSRPLSTKDLTLCQKIDLCVGEDKRRNKLNILREALTLKTLVHFDLTIDSTVCPYTAEDIALAVGKFSVQYDRNFRSAFSVKPKAQPQLLLLGGGVGYASKTVTYPALGKAGVERVSKIIDETLGYKAKKEHAHHKDAQLGVSPHMLKMTSFQNSAYEIGLCAMRIE